MNFGHWNLTWICPGFGVVVPRIFFSWDDWFLSHGKNCKSVSSMQCIFSLNFWWISGCNAFSSIIHAFGFQAFCGKSHLTDFIILLYFLYISQSEDFKTKVEVLSTSRWEARVGKLYLSIFPSRTKWYNWEKLCFFWKETLGPLLTRSFAKVLAS